MKRSTFLVLLLALLLLIAFLIRRVPRGPSPEHAPGRPAIQEPAPAKDPIARGAVPPPSSSFLAAAPADVEAPAAAPAAGTGSIRGVVRFNGPVPPRKTYRTHGDTECERMHGPRIVSDEFVADPYGNLQWAFVYIKSGVSGPVPPAPKTPVLLDQVSCVFTPHVSGIRVGQPLVIVNSDEFLHNVHAIPFTNKEFNFGLRPNYRTEETKTFDQPEVMIKFKCEIHPWMRAWVGVLDHPYFGVTNAVGSYVIRDVPTGSYVVEAWHEKCKPVKFPIGVAPGREALLDFVLDEQKE